MHTSRCLQSLDLSARGLEHFRALATKVCQMILLKGSHEGTKLEQYIGNHSQANHINLYLMELTII